MSSRAFAARLLAIVGVSVALGACAYEVAYRPDYVTARPPPFVAKARLLIVMPQEQRDFVYRGHPDSVTGDFTTLTVPLGAIVEDVAKQVFGGCFASGVDVVDSVDGQDGYVLALEGNLADFTYSYVKVIEQSFDENPTLSWIIPEVHVAFHVRAHDRAGATVLDKMYDSGIAEGVSYMVTGRPAERINQVLHKALQALMLQLTSDIRPLLTSQCEITEAGKN